MSVAVACGDRAWGSESVGGLDRLHIGHVDWSDLELVCVVRHV